MALIILFIVLNMWILAAPHDNEATNGTIPDEIAFYDWARIFSNGELLIPLEDLGGRDTMALTVPEPGHGFLNLDVETFSQDASKDNSIRVTVTDHDRAFTGHTAHNVP